MYNKNMLNPWLVTGFTDGEGCFSLSVVSDRQQRKGHATIYHRWRVDFCYALRGDDIQMLNQIKEFFNCGIVSLSNPTSTKTMHNYGQAQYHCITPADLVNKVIPHFENYPLHSKKQQDFEPWKEAAHIIKKTKDKFTGKWRERLVYLPEDEKRLDEIFNTLKHRVTGGHLTTTPRNLNLQGIISQEETNPYPSKKAMSYPRRKLDNKSIMR